MYEENFYHLNEDINILDEVSMKTRLWAFGKRLITAKKNGSRFDQLSKNAYHIKEAIKRKLNLAKQRHQGSKTWENISKPIVTDSNISSPIINKKEFINILEKMNNIWNKTGARSFSAASLRIMIRKDPEEFKKFLKDLNINVNFDDLKGPKEYQIYENIRNKIQDRINKTTNNNNMYGSLSSILQQSGIEFNKAETESNLIRKIISHKEEILKNA